MKNHYKCDKCGHIVKEEKELDYPFYCIECYENKYMFEVTKVK